MDMNYGMKPYTGRNITEERRRSLWVWLSMREGL